jgi:hypothetical protein
VVLCGLAGDAVGNYFKLKILDFRLKNPALGIQFSNLKSEICNLQSDIFPPLISPQPLGSA